MIGKTERSCDGFMGRSGPDHFFENRLGVRRIELEVIVPGKIRHVPLARPGVSLVDPNEIELRAKEYQRINGVLEEGIQGS